MAAGNTLLHSQRPRRVLGLFCLFWARWEGMTFLSFYLFVKGNYSNRHNNDRWHHLNVPGALYWMFLGHTIAP